MRIYIEVTDSLSRYIGGEKELNLELSDGATVEDAVFNAQIPQCEVGFVALNSSKVEDSYVLHNGDRLKIFHLIIGG